MNWSISNILPLSKVSQSGVTSPQVDLYIGPGCTEVTQQLHSSSCPLGVGLEIQGEGSTWYSNDGGRFRLVLLLQGLRWHSLATCGVLGSWAPEREQYSVSVVIIQLHLFNPQILRFDSDEVRMAGCGWKICASPLGLSQGKTHIEDCKSERVAWQDTCDF